MKTSSNWQGHLVTAPGHLCFMVQFKVDEWFTPGSRPTNWPWGKSFSHPRLMHTHPSTLFPALQPPNEILTLKEAAGSFITVSGLQESKSKMDVFLRTGTEQKDGNDYSNSSMF